MDVKKNIRKTETEVFDEIVVCEWCKKEIELDKEIVVKQEKNTNYDSESYRDFHFCDSNHLLYFLKNSHKEIFEEHYPDGFYFKEEVIK